MENKDIEEETRKSEKKLRLMKGIKDYAVFMLNSEGIISDWNESAQRIKGCSKEEIIGKHFSLFYTRKDKEKKIPERELEIAKFKGYFEGEGWRIRKDGSKFFAHIIIISIRDENGRITGFVKVAQDTTEKKKIEEKLWESEEKYRILAEKANDGICIIQNKKLKYLNPSLAKMYGGTVEELLETPFTDYVHPEALPEIVDRYKKRISGDEGVTQKYEAILKPRSGDDIYVEINASRIIYQKKPADLAIIRDITRRKKREEKIKRLYSLQKAIRRINQILLRVEDEPEFFQKICEIIVKEMENIRFSAVGIFQRKTLKIKFVAYKGIEKDCSSFIRYEWIDKVVRGKEPLVIRYTTQSASLRKKALKRNYRSAVILPLFYNGGVIGVLGVCSSEKDAFQGEEVEFLKEAAGDISIGIKSLRLREELEGTVRQLEKTTEGIVFTVEKITEIRDPYTSGHQKRVARLARAIAEEMGLSGKRVKGIYMTDMIHDIGKIYVPSEILSKPGKLTQIEFSLIKTHPQYGYDMLKDVEFPWPVALTILQHHERMDGSGYPQGLKGDEILLEARILAVADVVEAMSSYRPYRPALGIDIALEEVVKNRGKLYDTEVVDTCLKLFKERGFKFD